jgi:hypothetical protein
MELWLALVITLPSAVLATLQVYDWFREHCKRSYGDD